LLDSRIKQMGLLVAGLPIAATMLRHQWRARTSACRIRISINDSVKGATLVAVPVEAANEVASVLVAECDGYVLR